MKIKVVQIHNHLSSLNSSTKMLLRRKKINYILAGNPLTLKIVRLMYDLSM